LPSGEIVVEEGGLGSADDRNRKEPIRRWPPSRVAGPRYEPNPKHKPVPTPGRRGSICPPDVKTQELLDGSQLVNGKRYATDGERAYVDSATTVYATSGTVTRWDGKRFHLASVSVGSAAA